MNDNKKAKYYDTTDFSDLMRAKKGKKTGFPAKRITLNISDRIYDEANELDQYMRMGYQNVLKTAMTIGLTELFDHVSHHKMKIEKEPSLQSQLAHRKEPIRKKHSLRYARRLQNKPGMLKMEMASHVSTSSLRD
jgi:hypothetical protein